MSRKEKEVVVRLSEADLRAMEYIAEFIYYAVCNNYSENRK